MKLIMMLGFVSTFLLLSPAATATEEERRFVNCQNGQEYGQNCTELDYGTERICYRDWQDMNGNNEYDDGEYQRQYTCLI